MESPDWSLAVHQTALKTSCILFSDWPTTRKVGREPRRQPSGTAIITRRSAKLFVPGIIPVVPDKQQPTERQLQQLANSLRWRCIRPNGVHAEGLDQAAEESSTDRLRLASVRDHLEMGALAGYRCITHTMPQPGFQQVLAKAKIY